MTSKSRYLSWAFIMYYYGCDLAMAIAEISSHFWTNVFVYKDANTIRRIHVSRMTSKTYTPFAARFARHLQPVRFVAHLATANARCVLASLEECPREFSTAAMPLVTATCNRDQNTRAPRHQVLPLLESQSDYCLQIVA